MVGVRVIVGVGVIVGVLVTVGVAVTVGVFVEVGVVVGVGVDVAKKAATWSQADRLNENMSSNGSSFRIIGTGWTSLHKYFVIFRMRGSHPDVGDFTALSSPA